MLTLWIKGLLLHRPWRLLGSMAGVALTVALLSALGSFLSYSAATMTTRALQDVPVDWQVQLLPGTDGGTAQQAVSQTVSHAVLQNVFYADVASFSAQTGNSVQTTSAGKVLGISAAYAKDFPREIRSLTGDAQGVLIAQQTASNLHVKTGDSVSIHRQGLSAVSVKVAGIVDLPNADQLFQVVGAASGSAPQAPPDNVMLIPVALWHQLFDAQGKLHPDSVYEQLHVRIPHTLPTQPSQAYLQVQRLAKHLEFLMVGKGIVADNLAARLGSVRADALYAKILFLFLGIPGALLAAFLTLAVSASGGDRRRKEQALLRTRGASTRIILDLQALEALVIGIGGSLAGLAFGQLISTLTFPVGKASLSSMAIALMLGILLALLAVLGPVWLQARKTTVSANLAAIGHRPKPFWQWLYLDVLLLVVSAVVFWQTASMNYQLVLAPEGVPKTSVHYEAFLSPILFWIGGTLFFMRLMQWGLCNGSRLLGKAIQPMAKEMAFVVASAAARQNRLLTRGVILVALAFSFAGSTAVFNTTYNHQSYVDAQLTNGSDVTVTGTTAHPAGSKLAEFKQLSQAAAVEPMQHRFAYVGNDLQDLYGIDPRRITAVTNISNAYFSNHDAKATLQQLAAHPDGILVSQETVNDYQLHLGDLINIRLQNAKDHQYHVVPFHLLGVVNKFPTAPKDSFLVANASYIAQTTGTSSQEIVMMRTNGQPAALALQVRSLVHTDPVLKVSDILQTQETIRSSLTAVDLTGLTRIELSFAVLMAACATGLILALGLAERKRMFVILSALGARKKQLSSFIWFEGLWMLISGMAIGFGFGFGTAWILVKLLRGVFDPPPQNLAAPILYLLLLAAAATVSTLLVIWGAKATLKKTNMQSLRDI